MKGKTPLTLLELTVMLLVFALAAALCLQAFVWADRSSARVAREHRDAQAELDALYEEWEALSEAVAEQ